MLILPNYCLHSFVWCVWVRTARPCISCLPWLCFWLALACVFSCCFLLGAAGFFPFVVAVPWFWRCCCLLSCLFWRLGCLRCDLLFPGFPPSLPPWLSSGAFWSSQSCWSLPPGYLVVFATVRLSYLWHGVSWRLARVFPPLHGNKGFGPVWGFALSTMLWVLFMCPSLRR